MTYTSTRPGQLTTAEVELDHLLQAEVRASLQQMLGSQPFRTSKQCQDLLRYVVLHSLDGNDTALRERIIGAEVFGRKPSYDTNDDPVVRVRAADVRKRIAQYYQSKEPNTPALHIDFPPGSYRVHFRFEQPQPEISARLDVQTPELILPGETSPSQSEYASHRSRWITSVKILLSLGVLASIVLVGSKSFTTTLWMTPIERFWAPVANAKQPAIIYLGTNAAYVLSKPYLDQYGTAHGIVSDSSEFLVDLPPDSSIQAKGLIPLRGTFTSTSDSAAAVQITSLLASWHRPLVLRAGSDLSFGELRDRPSVMVGAFNNSWTLELTTDLPYRFRNGISIENRDQPERSWTVPKSDHNSVTVDYALLTRLLSSKAGGPLVTVAGIGQAGTQAAAEFLTNPDKMRGLLKDAPPDWERKNMQAVLQVKVVEHLPASVDVVAAKYW